MPKPLGFHVRKPMSEWKNILGYGVTLTELFKYRNVRQAWQEYLPLTGICVSTINRSFNRMVVIPPSSWVAENRRHSYLGKVYDHAIGLLMAGRSHLLPLREHISCDSIPSRLQSLFDPVEDLLERERPNVLAGTKGKEQLDFFLALALVTDLHAMASGYDPTLPLRLPTRVKSVDEIRAILRERYPMDFAVEIHRLFEVTKEDLPSERCIDYKPPFQAQWKTVKVATTGDLLIGDVLFELKVSKDLFKAEHLWQLLACAASNADRKQFSIRKVGAYNPRYRALWTKPVAQLVRQMGSPSFKAFQKWFKSTLPKQMDSTGRKFIQVT